MILLKYILNSRLLLVAECFYIAVLNTFTTLCVCVYALMYASVHVSVFRCVHVCVYIACLCVPVCVCVSERKQLFSSVCDAGSHNHCPPLNGLDVVCILAAVFVQYHVDLTHILCK